MDQLKKHAQKNKVAYTTLGLLLLFLLVGIVVQEANARFGAFGTIEIRDLPSTTSIRIDDKIVESTEGGISTITTNVRPGTRSILIEKNGYWSWTKALDIHEGETTIITPYLLARSPRLTNITELEELADFDKIESSFKKDKSRPENRALSSDDANVAIWQDNTGIYARYLNDPSRLPHYFCDDASCDKEITITSLRDVTVKTIEFLPGRFDVVLLTFEQGVFALELDKRSNQNLQPLTETPGADIRARDNESVYIKIGNEIGILTL